MEAHDAKRKAGLLTLDNVAEYLHVHPSTIYRMIKRNQLPAFKFGGAWRFNPESIRALAFGCRAKHQCRSQYPSTC